MLFPRWIQTPQGHFFQFEAAAPEGGKAIVSLDLNHLLDSLLGPGCYEPAVRIEEALKLTLPADPEPGGEGELLVSNACAGLTINVTPIQQAAGFFDGVVLRRMEAMVKAEEAAMVQAIKDEGAKEWKAKAEAAEAELADIKQRKEVALLIGAIPPEHLTLTHSWRDSDGAVIGCLYGECPELLESKERARFAETRAARVAAIHAELGEAFARVLASQDETLAELYEKRETLKWYEGQLSALKRTQAGPGAKV